MFLAIFFYSFENKKKTIRLSDINYSKYAADLMEYYPDDFCYVGF